MTRPLTKAELLDPLAAIRTDEVVVTTMSAVRPWGVRTDGELDFASADSAMGHAADLALGIAMARPDRQVLCLNGDGSMLMSLGTLVTIIASGVENLVLFILENGGYEITGRQPIPGAGVVDFAALARASGFEKVWSPKDAPTYAELLPKVLADSGPRCLCVPTAFGNERPISRRPEEPSPYLRSSFQASAHTLRDRLAR